MWGIEKLFKVKTGYTGQDAGLSILREYVDLRSFLQAAVTLGSSRLERYQEYDKMEEEVFMGAGLEMYTDDAFQVDEESGLVVWAKAGAKYEKEINEFFEQINLVDKLWGWTFLTAKYGDFFLGVEGKSGVGITKINENEPKEEVFRLEEGGSLFAFLRQSSDEFVPAWEMVHFLNGSRPSMESVEVKIKIEEKFETKILTASYGTSILFAVREAYKRYKTLEEMIALARLARSPVVRMFHVNTEGVTPDERREMIRAIRKKVEKKEFVDWKKKSFDAKFAPLSFLDNIYIPHTGGLGDVRTENLGGDVDIKNIVDFDHSLNKVFAGIRIPKSFLGFEESLPGSMGNTTLTRLDIRYARSVKRLKKAMLNGLARLVLIHLTWLFKRSIPFTFLRCLRSVKISSAEDQERMEILNVRLGVAQGMLSFLPDLEGVADKKVLLKYIFTVILDLRELDIFALFKEGSQKARDFVSIWQKLPAQILEECKKKGFSMDDVKDVLEEAKGYVLTDSYIPTGVGDLKAPLPVEDILNG